MLQFLFTIPKVVLYGCGILIAAAIAMGIALLRQKRRVGSQIGLLTDALNSGSSSQLQRRDGLLLAPLDEIRRRCEELDEVPDGAVMTKPALLVAIKLLLSALATLPTDNAVPLLTYPPFIMTI